MIDYYAITVLSAGCQFIAKCLIWLVTPFSIFPLAISSHFYNSNFVPPPFRVLVSLLEVRLGFSYCPYYVNDAPSACTAGMIIKIPQMLGLVLPTVPSLPNCENGIKILPKEPALFQAQERRTEGIEAMKNGTELLSDCLCIKNRFNVLPSEDTLHNPDSGWKISSLRYSDNCIKHSPHSGCL